MKWRLSGFSQVVQIRAPVSAAELRFPPARTSQQTSTSIIRLMDLIRAGAASPGLGAGEVKGAGGQRSPRHAAEGRGPFPMGQWPVGTAASPRRYLALPDTWVCANSISKSALSNKRDLGISSPGSPIPPHQNACLPSSELPQPTELLASSAVWAAEGAAAAAAHCHGARQPPPRPEPGL